MSELTDKNYGELGKELFKEESNPGPRTLVMTASGILTEMPKTPEDREYFYEHEVYVS